MGNSKHIILYKYHLNDFLNILTISGDSINIVQYQIVLSWQNNYSDNYHYKV